MALPSLDDPITDDDADVAEPGESSAPGDDSQDRAQRGNDHPSDGDREE